MGIKLELQGLTKKYGNQKVFDNLDLTIEDNEFFVVLGPSGTGKSTLLKLIVGIEEPDSGKIILNGKDITHLPINRRNISMVFQNYALYPNMSVFDNIAFPLRMHHVGGIKRKVQDAAEKLNISDILKKNVTRISGGQKQRVALARAIVREPAIFLLDEPLSNLDARIRYTAREELKRIQRELDNTFVFVTHDQSEAASMADRVAVLNGGKVEQIDPFEKLYETPRTEWLGDFIGNYPMSFLPGSVVGEPDDIRVGFRSEWLEESTTGFQVTVEAMEITGDTYFLFCRTDDGTSIVFKSLGRRSVGDKLKLKINRYNKYRDGELVS